MELRKLATDMDNKVSWFVSRISISLDLAVKIAFYATLIFQVDSNKNRDSIGTTIRQLRAPPLKQFC